jgi:transposase, IS6 family
MMQERGVEVEPSTIMRWSIAMHLSWRSESGGITGYRATSWRVDETYVKVGGRWKYLFRAVDKHGRLIDFMLLDRRNTGAAYRFLGKALSTMRHWPPSSITTDRLGSYPRAISRLQREGKLSGDTKHRTCKYLNNIIEADHGALKRVIRPTRGFQTHEDGSRDDQGIRSDANDPSRPVPHVQAACQRRGPFRQQTVRSLQDRGLMKSTQQPNCDQHS